MEWSGVMLRDIDSHDMNMFGNTCASIPYDKTRLGFDPVYSTNRSHIIVIVIVRRMQLS
jgi:hypothetical protein